jgi:hypothetical protein
VLDGGPGQAEGAFCGGDGVPQGAAALIWLGGALDLHESEGCVGCAEDAADERLVQGVGAAPVVTVGKAGPGPRFERHRVSLYVAAGSWAEGEHGTAAVIVGGDDGPFVPALRQVVGPFGVEAEVAVLWPPPKTAIVEWPPPVFRNDEWARLVTWDGVLRNQ